MTAALAAWFLLPACSPDLDGEIGSLPTASFNMTPVPGKANTWLLESTSQHVFGYQWLKGVGSFANGKAIDTAYFGQKGKYTVTLRVFGQGGQAETSQEVEVVKDDLENHPIFKLLIAKTWVLNPTPGANTIIVGTENNPAEYFGGGSLDGCQTDDEYKFNLDLTLNYKANGSTFNAGNIQPNYSCGTDRSYTGQAFTFAPGTSQGAGIASISINSAVPNRFIGVTDVSSNNYRIISIDENSMVLRSGTATETVHQFKFIAK